MLVINTYKPFTIYFAQYNHPNQNQNHHSPKPSTRAQGTTLWPRPRCIPGTISTQCTVAWSEPAAYRAPAIGTLRRVEPAPPPTERSKEHTYK